MLGEYIFAEAMNSFFGPGRSPFGDPRDVLTGSINRELSNGTNRLLNGVPVTTNNLIVGSSGRDYITGYNWTFNEVDVSIGGQGADIFVAGDRNGIHYRGSAISIAYDYNLFQGDVVQLSARGMGGYRWQRGNFGLGGSALDTIIFFGNDAIIALPDTSRFNYVWA